MPAHTWARGFRGTAFQPAADKPPGTEKGAGPGEPAAAGAAAGSPAGEESAGANSEQPESAVEEKSAVEAETEKGADEEKEEEEPDEPEEPEEESVEELVQQLQSVQAELEAAVHQSIETYHEATHELLVNDLSTALSVHQLLGLSTWRRLIANASVLYVRNTIDPKFGATGPRAPPPRCRPIMLSHPCRWQDRTTCSRVRGAPTVR